MNCLLYYIAHASSSDEANQLNYNMLSANESCYDRAADLKAFDETKAGVKGLVDAGISTIPPFFIHSPKPGPSSSLDPAPQPEFAIPVIDLSGVGKNPESHTHIVERIRVASETWGFFQVLSHGIPTTVLEEMLEGVRRFHEQDSEVKKAFYTRDVSKKVVYNSNYDLYTGPAANWRDTFYCLVAPHPPNSHDLPSVCREVTIEYSQQVMRLGSLLLELLSEALGLKKSHLNDMDCNEGLAVLCHYYPRCPQPELTLGTSKHADDGFLTVLLQDQIGGLQVLHQNHWVDVHPVPGALVINIGDLLQLISNDKFKSIEHRVVANREGPRVSVACFFSTSFQDTPKMYAPIQELLSQDNPPRYRGVTVQDYVTYGANKENEVQTSGETMVHASSERLAELKAFDEAKIGVKGLVDAGISKVPSIFIHPLSPSLSSPPSPKPSTSISIPVIDLSGIKGGSDPRRKDLVESIRDASEKWGFFQVVNHGIPILVLESMLEGVRGFFEQDDEVKKTYYSRDYNNGKVAYNSNFDLYTGLAANWRDTFFCMMAPSPPHLEDLPSSCREILVEYSKQVMKLGELLFELLSEAIRLQSGHLNKIGCGEGMFVLGHYYPPCPQPELTIGTSKHADHGFITLLLQDQVGGLQILHEDYWIDVPPTPGALVVNIGDLLQLISNDKLKSVEHRVLANSKGPRLSVACFFSTLSYPTVRVYGPIKELVAKSNPPKYRETTAAEYFAHYQSKGLNGRSALDDFKL